MKRAISGKSIVILLKGEQLIIQEVLTNSRYMEFVIIKGLPIAES